MTDKVYNGTPKGYAVSLGIGEAGRGRPSRAQMDAIAKARAEGITFTSEGAKPVKAVTVEKASSEPAKTPEKGVRIGKDLRQGAARTSPESSVWVGEVYGKTVKVSGKTACGVCGVSLAYHTCANPRAVVGSGDYVPVSLQE